MLHCTSASHTEIKIPWNILPCLSKIFNILKVIEMMIKNFHGIGRFNIIWDKAYIYLWSYQLPIRNRVLTMHILHILSQRP